MSDFVRCPTCSNEQIKSNHTIFCYKDGSKMESVETHACGYEIGRYDIFCPKCGERVKETANAKS